MERPFQAYEGNEPYVFVCYAHDDKELVYPEITRLKEAGFNIWYDEGIVPGSEWSETLARHITASAVFLYLVTPRSVESEHCRHEVNFALEEHRAILAVHLEPTDVRPGLRLSLNARQGILKYEHPKAVYEAKLTKALHAAQANEFEDPAAPSTLKLGEWTLDVGTQRLSRGDHAHTLDPKAQSVLLHLVDRAPEVVSREGLMAHTWRGVVVGENVLDQAITQLRRALDDDARDPKYIETLPKRGYRLLVSVDLAPKRSDGISVEKPTRERDPVRPHPLNTRMVAVAIIVAAIVGLVGWAGLKYFGASSDVPIRSIAVLPLENLSEDPEQEYIADGLTEELIGELAKLGSLRVISRTSVMRYKQSTKSIPEIAAELGIDGVLTGTITREQDRFRITVQLTDARTDTHLWADQFDRELSSVLALRSDVARAVTEQIQLELTPEEETALTSSRRVDPLAYDAYWRGLQLRGPWTLARAWGPQALEHYEQAVALDPDFAEAWFEISSTRFWLGQTEKAREAAERALELDASLGAAHALLAGVRMVDWNFAGARRATERAVQLSPNDPLALEAYSTSLMRHGRYAESLRVSERIPLVAPFDPYSRTGHLIKLLFLRHYERTLEEAERLRELIPGFYADDESFAYAKLGRLREAHDALIAFFEQCGKPCDPAREASERGWAKGGPAGALRARIDAAKDAEALPSFSIADGYAHLGETDEALAWLERGYRERDPSMFMTSVYPGFDSIRPDPRFDDLLRRMGFPENESPAMLADVGQALALAGHAEEAIASLEKALQLAPEDERLPRWRYYMAMAHFAAERYEQAANWAQRALEDEASSYSLAFSHLLLASSSAYLGRLDQARESLEEALRLWPGVAIKWDLSSVFVAGDSALRNRYLDGLRKAGMEG